MLQKLSQVRLQWYVPCKVANICTSQGFQRRNQTQYVPCEVANICTSQGFQRRNQTQYVPCKVANICTSQGFQRQNQTQYGILLLTVNKHISNTPALISAAVYSRTSMARTLKARFPRLFRTHSWVPWKLEQVAAYLG